MTYRYHRNWLRDVPKLSERHWPHYRAFRLSRPVPCIKCGAPGGSPCRSSRGGRVEEHSHQMWVTRIEYARRYPDLVVSREEDERRLRQYAATQAAAPAAQAEGGEG